MKLSSKTMACLFTLHEKLRPRHSDDIESLKQEFIDTEIENMIKEVEAAEVIVANAFDKDNRFVSRSYDNTYPKWYRDIRPRNKAEFVKIAKSKKGTRYKRIADIAHDRLVNGYKSKTDYQYPENTYRALLDIKAFDDDGVEVPF
jgi:hypothetical protein